MEQPAGRLTFEMIFRKALDRPMMGPETGEITSVGKVFYRRHKDIEELAKKVLKKAEDM